MKIPLDLVFTTSAVLREAPLPHPLPTLSLWVPAHLPELLFFPVCLLVLSPAWSYP